MRKRILAVTAATSLALGTLAGSALAHHNTAADKSVGPPSDVPGWAVGHTGMECAAMNPQTPIESLAAPPPAGLGLVCPAATAP